MAMSHRAIGPLERIHSDDSIPRNLIMARNCMPSLLIPDALLRFSRFITVHASIEMYGG